MEELGYKPNILARGLVTKRSRVIALLFPTSGRGLGLTELGFVTSAADTAREHSYNLVLWSLDVEDTDQLRELIQQGLVDGVIVMEVHLYDPRINLLRELEFPFTLIGRSSETDHFDFADIDFVQTARDAVLHLIELGHTHIGFVNHPHQKFNTGYGPAVQIQIGFEDMMEAHNLTPRFRFCATNPQGGYDACRDLLAEDPDLTAIITMNERAIPGIMQAIAEQGWTIPDDFSLVSVVSSPNVAQMSIPPLTSLDAPNIELGRLGTERLIQKLEGTADHATAKDLLPCHLVVRGSSGPVRPF
jgi:DNA-binding LacI/PurR family transcriptional regulator